MIRSLSNLDSAFIQPMIRSLYRGRIIGQYIYSVQSISVVSIAVVGSYILTPVVGSYLLALSVDFLPIYSDKLRALISVISPYFVFIALSTHTDSTSNTTLAEFSELPDDSSESENSRRDFINKDGSSDYRDDETYSYARQSDSGEEGDEADRNTSSINTQLANNKETAEDHGRKVIGEFVDKDESGFSFNRPDFQRMIEQVEKRPRPITVDRIDRLGRDTLETVYVAAKIHYEYDVTISTHRHGDYDLAKLNDQIMLVVNAIVAGKSVKDRIRSAWETIWTRFLEERRWYSWFDKVPVGYQLAADEKWIEPHPHGGEVIRAMMHDLLMMNAVRSRSGVYKPTAELVQKAAINDSFEVDDNSAQFHLPQVGGPKIQEVFEASDYDLDSFSWSNVKAIAENSVYRGEIRIPQSAEPEEQHVEEDDSLLLIDDELAEQIDNLLSQVSKKYSKTDEESIDAVKLGDLGLILIAEEVSDIFGPVCPECNQGMVKNRKAPLSDGSECHYYLCPNYKDKNSENHPQRKFPYEKEWEAMKNTLDEDVEDGSDVVVLRIC